MKKLREKPILTSSLITILFLVVINLVSFLWFLPVNNYTEIIYELITVILAFVFVCIFGDVKIYAQGGFGATIKAASYIFVVETAYLLAVLAQTAADSETVWKSGSGILLGVLTLFGIGFREEGIFRGIIVNRIGKKYMKDRKGILITAWSSGAIFGLVHLANVFAGVNFFSALIQSVVAVGVGFYLAAVYLRGGNIWALVLVHAITDGASMFGSLFTDNNGTVIDVMDSIGLMNITPFFVFWCIGTFLLREQECEKIIERFRQKETPEA